MIGMPRVAGCRAPRKAPGKLIDALIGDRRAWEPPVLA